MGGMFCLRVAVHRSTVSMVRAMGQLAIIHMPFVRPISQPEAVIIVTSTFSGIKVDSFKKFQKCSLIIIFKSINQFRNL